MRCEKEGRGWHRERWEWRSGVPQHSTEAGCPLTEQGLRGSHFTEGWGTLLLCTYEYAREEGDPERPNYT